MATRIRSIVSGKKARTSNGEHDLDLIHLTDRIIIMGWPAAGFEGMYRNQRKDVVKYLNVRASQSTGAGEERELSFHPEVPDVPGALDAKLQYILKYHTSRRMKPGTTARGVSISSQQRFLQYFARTLSDRDPRPPPGSPIRLIKLEYIQINGPGMSGIAKSILGGKQIAVQLRRYKDSIATKLRDWEVALKSTPTEVRAAEPDFNDDDWDDQVDMLVRSADLVEHVEGSKGPEDVTSRKLYPAATYYPPSTTDKPPLDDDSAKAEAQRDGGILLDADREVQFRYVNPPFL
ncbi:hypothetical protein RQP46_003062 [Phenoliferia psychrophenolica]